MNLILGVLTTLALIPSLLFIIDYGRRRWWTSPEGRYMFLKACVIATMLSAILLARIIGSLGLFVWSLLMGCLAVAQWTLYALYRRAQNESENSHV